MTKKDFQFIADALKAAAPLARDGEEAMRAWRRTVVEFAQRLETANPRFSKSLFYAACVGNMPS